MLCSKGELQHQKDGDTANRQTRTLRDGGNNISNHRGMEGFPQMYMLHRMVNQYGALGCSMATDHPK